jgi:general secretion pathway protein H
MVRSATQQPRSPRHARGLVSRGLQARGFTLLELMVVVAIIAVAAGLVTVSLPDPRVSALEREATRLTALLESARAQSRAADVPVAWLPQAGSGSGSGSNFQFPGLPKASDYPSRWLDKRVRAEVIGAKALTLGPEPILPAQRVVLHLEELQLSIQTDGLNPFAIQRFEEAKEPAS